MSINRTTIALAAVSAVAAVSLLVAPGAGASAPAAPSSERAARAYFGAIALAADGAAGYAYDFGTKRAALRAAHQRCKSLSDYPDTCTRVGWVRNACGAVAVKFRPDGFVARYKFGWGRSKAVAIRMAKRNFGGDIRAWVCTARR